MSFECKVTHKIANNTPLNAKKHNIILERYPELNDDEPYIFVSNHTCPEDIETILKIKKVIDSVNSNANDPNVALLSSLKPYLRDGKKAKVDQYIKIMNMTKAMALFSDLGGDLK